MSDITVESSRARAAPATDINARDFRRLMRGSSVSKLGSRVSTIACPLLALYLTKSPVSAGLVAFAATVPTILAYVPAGALVDHWDPRRTMLICEAGRGIAIAIIAISLAVGQASIPLLVVVVFAEETLEVFSTLADRRCVRALVPLDQAQSAQSLVEARTHAAVLAGRPLGVLFFGVAPIFPFLADAMSFVVSVGSIIRLESRRMAVASTDRISLQQKMVKIGDDIGAGLSWLVGDKYARVAMTVSASTTLVGQALIMIFLAGAHAQRLPSLWVGLVLAASGVGGVLGSLSRSWLPKPRKASMVLTQMVAWVWALTLLALFGWGSFLCMAIVMGTLSVTGARGNLEIDTYLAQHVDESMHARATSIGSVIAYSASAVGPMLGGVLEGYRKLSSTSFRRSPSNC